MNTAITKPELPPRSGYIEIIDENGNHVYKATAETEAKLQLQSDLANAKLQLQQSDDTAIELYEKATNLETITAQQDDSIIALFEAVNS